jgi:hypothetical protein
MPFRSGEVIEGNVIITRPPASADGKPIPTVKVESLKLQAYFESRNLFWHFDVAQPKTGVEKVKSKIKPGMMQKFESTVGHEVHRGFVRDEDIEMSFRNSGDMVLRFDELGEDSVSLPFAFTIPSRMTVTEWNKQYPNAPRDLCPVERSPPPSYPDSPIASVQWVVEAVLELDKSTEVEVDDRMFKQPNPSVVVTRIVFPFLPKDSDAQDLSTVPYFGRDLSEDMFKAAIVWEGDASEVKRLPPGRTGTWRTYEKIIKLNEGSLMNAEAALYAQVGQLPRILTQESLRNNQLALNPFTNFDPPIRSDASTNPVPFPQISRKERSRNQTFDQACHGQIRFRSTQKTSISSRRKGHRAA